MYSNVKSVQLLVAMLKEKKIRNIVSAAGTTHDAIIRSAENDGYFKIYSVVDERSAAFFAVGLIQELNEPVAIMCTAGTAASNFLSGVTEAYFRKLPLVVITAAKNSYYINQRDDQTIPQLGLYDGVIKYKVELPIIKDDKDYWYCERLLNEVFLEMNHHGVGPVQINIPIEEGMFARKKDVTTEKLPKIKVIDRIDNKDKQEKWKEKIEKLKKCSKIMVIYGQNNPISNKEKEVITEFCKKYNCVISSEKISNFYNDYTVETGGIGRKAEINQELMPEIVIIVNGNSVTEFQFRLIAKKEEIETWLVSEEGIVQDHFRNLTNIFECTTEEFFKKITTEEDIQNDEIFLNNWKKALNDFKIPELEYSNLYTMKCLFEKMPENSILNLANSMTPRNASLFDLNKNIPVYCNRGINGIDGSMSTFIGQSAVTKKLSFLVIGDLSFFYDMNALWNRYLGKNIRIMLNNNEGGCLFHFNQGLGQIPTLNNVIAAEHFATAKGWAESQGFKYISSHNKKEFDKNLNDFIDENSDKPIIFEVFTDKAKDAQLAHDIYNANEDSKTKMKKQIKQGIKKIIGKD